MSEIALSDQLQATAAALVLADADTSPALALNLTDELRCHARQSGARAAINDPAAGG